MHHNLKLRNALHLLALAITLPASGSLLAQSGNHALRLGPGTTLQFPHHPTMLTGSTATIEYWVKGSGTMGDLFWTRYVGFQEHKALIVLANGGLNYLYAGSPWHQQPSYGGVTVPGAGTIPADGSWHHLAFVRRPTGRWSIYVDGVRLVDEGPGTGLGGGCWLTCGVIETTTSTVIGNGSTTTPSWEIDELRVSNNERYSGNFTPNRFFTTDANAVMHLTFDEGQGSQVVDRSAAQQVGTFTGTNPTWTWVPTLQATFQTLGAGCAGSAGVPSLTNLNGSLPRAGSSLQLQITNLPTVATVCVPFFGFNSQSIQGLPLPLSLAAYGMPGCMLYTDVYWSSFVVGTNGSAAWSVPIPTLPSMLGTFFHQQALVFDAQAANPARRSITNAATARIGG